MPEVQEIQVELITLEMTFPSNWIKMVAMQPHVYLTGSEPYSWPDDKKMGQIAGMIRTLEIAKSNQAHFTLFPEYSIPGLDGINAINDVIAQDGWPSDGSIIIGGIDALGKGEYQQLCQQPNTICHDHNSPTNMGQNEWVNCSVVWVKNDSGQLNRYVQPKICPAWPEKNIHWQEMFCGKAVYVFAAKYENNFPCLFISLVCFDWIGKIENSDIKVVDSFLQSMNAACKGNPQPLHWIFVLQENDEPNHDLFAQATSSFLTQRSQYALVDRSKSVIVLINNSARNENPNRAFTSCVFPPEVSLDNTKSPSTFSFASERLRGRVINRCSDVVFREQRPCIHSFKVIVTQFLDLTQESRCRPLEEASVYALDEQTNDARFPGDAVPACLKWVNDKLDIMTALSSRVSIEHLGAEAANMHDVIIGTMKQLQADKHEENVHYATASHSSNENWRNADNWASEEENALEHLLDTLTMISTAHNTEAHKCSLHATASVSGAPVEIVAIRGKKHDDCYRYFNEHVARPVAHKTLLITQDDSNSVIVPRLLKKFTVPNPSENKITQPGGGDFIKDYQTVLRAFQQANSLDEFRQEVASYVT